MLNANVHGIILGLKRWILSRDDSGEEKRGREKIKIKNEIRGLHHRFSYIKEDGNQ